MNKKTIYFILFLSLVSGLIIYQFSPIQNQAVPTASVLIAQVSSGEPRPVPQPLPPPPPPAPTPRPAPRRTTPVRPAAPAETSKQLPLSYLRDTDNDGFSDRTETDLKTDPKNNLSYPPDENHNGTDDAWEQTSGITINDGGEDTDKDGLSDKLEYMHGTDPLKTDGDNDTFTDAEEILELKTDANDVEDPGSLDKIGIRITNLDENQSIGDPQPFVKGVAPKDSTIETAIFNAKKEERILGRTVTHENSIFIFLIPEILEDGEYDLVARVIEPPKTTAFLGTPIARAQTGDTLQEESVVLMESKPVHIKINKALDVIPPNPQKLADQTVTEENLLKDLRIEIIDNQPVLFGKAAYNSEVVATWRSIVIATAIITDSPRGEFAISAFHPLEAGDHEIFVQAVRLRDNAMSKTIKVPFTIVEPEAASTQETQVGTQETQPVQTHPAPPATETTSSLTDLISGKYSIYFLPVAALALLAIITNIVTFVRLKKRPKNKDQKDGINPPPAN